MKRVGHFHSGLRRLTGIADAESKYWKITIIEQAVIQLSISFLLILDSIALVH